MTNPEEEQYQQDQYVAQAQDMSQYAMQGMPYGGMQRSDRADLLDKINPDEIVEKLRHYLMGEIKEGGEWIKKPELQRNAVTEVGAWELCNLVLSVSNRNTSLSMLTDQEIKMRAYEVVRTAIFKMNSNFREYGIRNGSQIDYLSQILFSIVLITLKQPEGAGIRNLIKNTTSEVRSIVEAPQQSGKKSVFGRVFGR